MARVLVVDDDVVREILAASLQRAGHAVLDVSSAAAALEAITSALLAAITRETVASVAR